MIWHLINSFHWKRLWSCKKYTENRLVCENFFYQFII